MAESSLQSQCVLWLKNTYPEYRNKLFAVFNEGKNVTYKLSIGLTPGVCDLLYIGESGILYGFEMKQRGSTHSRAHLLRQSNWMRDALPGRAWFCDSLDGFKSFFTGDTSKLLPPEDVYEYCINYKDKKNISWDAMSAFLRG